MAWLGFIRRSFITESLGRVDAGEAQGREEAGEGGYGQEEQGDGGVGEGVGGRDSPEKAGEEARCEEGEKRPQTTPAMESRMPGRAAVWRTMLWVVAPRARRMPISRVR